MIQNFFHVVIIISKSTSQLDDKIILSFVDFVCSSSSSTRIIFSWVVSTRKDISDFRAIIFPSQGARTQSNDLSNAIPIFDYRLDPIVEKDIGYGIRTSFIDGLESENYYVLCIIGRRSSGELTLLKRKQCRTVGPLSGCGTHTEYRNTFYLSLFSILLTAFFVS